MDETPRPPAPTTQVKHHMPKWLKILVWTVVIGVGAVVAYFAYVIVVIIMGLSTIANKCTASQQKATAASNQYAAELNNLGPILTQPYVKAQPSPSGDCIDTSSHTASATLEKLYPTPQPLLHLSASINAGLQANGFKQKQSLALETIQNPTDPIDVLAVYSKAGFPDLTVTYFVGHNPSVCDQVPDASYNTCVLQYEDSFKNLSVQNVSEVDLEMTQDFSNNY